MYDDLLGKKEDREEEIVIIPQPINPKHGILMSEVSKLSKFLLDEFPGEIKGSAVDTAIRLLKYYKDM